MFSLIRRRIIPVVVVLFLSSNLSGQSTANANISATITEVVGATNLSDISFEKFVVRSKVTSIELKSEIIGEKPNLTIVGNDYAYSLTLPASPVILKRMGSNETIKADCIIMNSSKGEDNDANLNIFLSTTLQGAIYHPGYYRSVNPIPVTIHYN